MENAVNSIKSGHKIILIRQSDYKKDFDNYSIQKHSEILIRTSLENKNLEYIMIKRKNLLIILENDCDIDFRSNI